MANTKPATLKVACPCCGTVLHLDRETGAVLLEERPRKGTFKTLDEAAREASARHEQAKAQLERAMDEARHKDEILEKKFREAVKKAEEDDTRPPRPFDFD